MPQPTREMSLVLLTLLQSSCNERVPSGMDVSTQCHDVDCDDARPGS